LTFPENSNSLVSILVGIGLLFTLVKTPSAMMQMINNTSRNGVLKKVSSQIINVIATKVATL